MSFSFFVRTKKLSDTGIGLNTAIGLDNGSLTKPYYRKMESVRVHSDSGLFSFILLFFYGRQLI